MRFLKRDSILYFLTGCIVLFAIVLNALRLFAWYGSVHPKTIEHWIDTNLHQTITIGSAHLTIERFTPVFSLNHVTLMDPTTQSAALQVERVALRLNVWRSLWQRAWILNAFTVQGVELHFVQDKTGHWQLQNAMQPSPAFSADSFAENLYWLSEQPKIEITHSKIILTPNVGAPIILQHLSAFAKGTPAKEKMALQGTLKRSSIKEKRTPFLLILHFHLQLNKTVCTIQKVNAFLQVKNVSMQQLQLLPQHILQPLPDDGILGAMSWARWQAGKIQYVQSNIHLRQVVFQKNHFQRFSGDFLWKPENQNHWSLAAKNIAVRMLDESGIKKFSLNPELALTGAFHLYVTSNGAKEKLFFSSFNVRNTLFSIAARAHLFLPTQKISLLAHFQFKNMHAIVPWLQPFHVPPSDWAWANRAIKGGAIQSGVLLWDGLVSDFPYLQHNGVFTLQAHLSNASVEYIPHWPMATGIDGDFEWHNGSFSLMRGHAVIANIPVQAWSASILDVRKPILNVHVRTPLALEKINGLIQKTDWQSAPSLKPLNAQGNANLQVALQIPLLHPETMITQGMLQFTNDSIAWSDLPSIFTLYHIQGNLNFKNDNLYSTTALTSQFLNQPMALQVSTVTQNKVPVLRIGGTSVLAPVQSLKTIFPSIANFVSGKTAYHLQLNIPYPESLPNFLTFNSNLKGLGIQIQNHYQKAPDQIKPLQFTWDLLAADRTTWFLHYANVLQGAGNWVKQKNVWSITRADVNLCGNSAVYPTLDGLSVCVKIPALNADTLLQSSGQSVVPNFLPPLRTAEIMTGQFHIAGENFPNVDMQIEIKGKSAWNISVKSPNATGELQYSKNPDALTAQFQALSITTPLQHTQKTSMLPSNLPMLAVHVQNLNWNEKNVGAVTVDTHSITGGLTINHFQIQMPTCFLDSTGNWQNAGQQLLQWQGNLHCDDFGKWLQPYTPKPVVADGKGDIHFNLAWLAASDHPLQNLNGTISATAKNGAIIGLTKEQQSELGIGKLLNAFSLQNLKQNVQNGFQGLRTSGYGFNTFSSDFTIQKGIAETKNIFFDGPVAKITGDGTINLVQENYDLHLTVLPYVTSSLPVVAAFAGGPVVGAVAYLVNKAVSPQVSKRVAKNVALQGNWATGATS